MLVIEGGPENSDERRRSGDEVADAPGYRSRCGRRLERPRVDYPSVRKHHAERSAADDLSDREIEECDQRDDDTGGNSSLRGCKIAVDDSNDCKKRRRAQRDRQEVYKADHRLN